MSDLQVRVPTTFRSLSEARPSLERALEAGAGFIESSWGDEELRLSGPGATARVTCHGGELVGLASLAPPASFFASTIRSQFEEVLRRGAVGDQAREQR